MIQNVDMEREMTTIKINKITHDKLNQLKIHPRQSFEEVLLGLIEKHKTLLDFSPSSLSGSITTIKISKDTVDKLNQLKIHPRQSFEELITAFIK